MSAIFKPKEFDEVNSHGLNDGVKYQLNCRDCDNPLAIIWSVNENFTFRDGTPYFYNFVVKCPFCGSESESKKINGEVRVLEIVNEDVQPDGAVIERHVTKFHSVDYIDEDELCVLYMSKP